MSTTTLSRLTAEEYLAIERAAEGRSEFVDGRIRPMASSNCQHATIVMNASVALHQALRPLNRFALAVNMRVELPCDMITYPDVCVPAQASKFRDGQRDVLLNPELILEVFSPETEVYDRGRRFQRYRAMDSVQTYVLVSQETPLVEVYSLGIGGSWDISFHHDGTVEFPNLKCRIEMSEIYDHAFDLLESAPSH